MPERRTTVIRGGRVLDIRAHAAPAADLLIEGDAIVQIGPPGLPAPAGAAVVDARGKLLHAGLINAHMHGHGNLAKGMGDRFTLELLLAAGPWFNGHRTVEDRYLGTLIGALEMLMKGCTACYDLTAEFPAPTVEGIDACARAYADAGIRAVVAPMMATSSFFEAVPGLYAVLPPGLQKEIDRLRLAPAEAQVAVTEKILAGWRFDRDLVRPAVAPTIPHHCSDEFMRECGRLAREQGVGLHMHVQESKVQAIVALRKYGKTAAAHLEALGLLGPQFVVAHGVWLDPEDMRRLAGAGSHVAHNPGSNMRLGNGLADVRGMLDAGLNVGIGTDGASCSDNLNVYEAMRVASYASKVQGPEISRWLTTEEILEAATAGSARALGLGDHLGRLAPGYKADIVFLDTTHVNWLPFNDPTNQIVHTEDGSAVHSVMVGGRMVVENGRPLGVDLAGLAAKVESARERLVAANADNKLLYERLSTLVNAYCPGMARTPYHIDRFGGGHHDHYLVSG